MSLLSNFLMNEFASLIVRKPHQYYRHLTAIVDTNQSNQRGAQEGKSYTTFAFPSIWLISLWIWHNLKCGLRRKTCTQVQVQCNEIFDPIFFILQSSNLPSPLTNGLKYFRFWFRFRRVIRIFLNLQGV